MKNHRDAGAFAAAVTISALATAGFSWAPVLMGWCIGTIILLLLPEQGEPGCGKIGAGAMLVSTVFVLAAAALGAEAAFPEETTFPFISLGLLLLTWRAMCGQRETPGDVSNVLGMILLPLLGIVLLFGFRNLAWRENIPTKFPWFQAYLSTAATCPWWCLRSGKKEKSSWIWYGASAALSLGFCLLTRGILGSGLVEYEKYPLYRAIQTIRILGVLQRFEAVSAATILMGAFAIMALTADRALDAMDILLPNIRRRWKSGAVVLAAFLCECGYRLISNGAVDVVETVFWVLTPLLALWVVFSRRKQNPVKNP